MENKKTVFNYSKLREKIKKVCGSQFNFAEQMGWSDRTTTYKLNSVRYWKTNEILKAIEILNLTLVDIPEYFFTEVNEHIEN